MVRIQVIERILLSVTATPDTHISMFYLLPAVLFFSPFIWTSSFYDNPEQDPFPPTSSDSPEELHRKWDFEVFIFLMNLNALVFFPRDFIIDLQQWGFSGISTFAHLKHVKCLSERNRPLSVDVQNLTHDHAWN